MDSRVKALSLVLLSIIFFASKNLYARPIQFSKEVPPDQAETLKSDLRKDLTLLETPESLRVFGTPDLKDRTLKNWLTRRVGYVIGENEDYIKKLYILQQPYTYINQLMPTPEIPKNPPVDVPGHKVFMVMANLGVGFYRIGKQQTLLAGYAFETEERKVMLSLRSPRVGIIQIGEGLFNESVYKANPGSIVNSYFRVGTLFHEAHHSDGNGKTLGLGHAVCPDDVEELKYYKNRNACDRDSNGPYAVGAEFYKQARATCVANKTCRAGEAEVLAFLALDSKIRIIDSKTVDTDPEE